jgi:hypothetical protein
MPTKPVRPRIASDAAVNWRLAPLGADAVATELSWMKISEVAMVVVIAWPLAWPTQLAAPSTIVQYAPRLIVLVGTAQVKDASEAPSTIVAASRNIVIAYSVVD